ANVTKARCPESRDGSISLTITGGTAPYNIFWSDGVTSQNRTDLGVGTYSVVISDVNGCSASLDVVVEATMYQDCLQIPTIFTPNGDGVNDEWIITNISAYPKAEIKVYTRWGKLVFHSKNLSEDPWDGRFNGRLMPVDSYHYIMNLHDGSEEISGVITIIR
ncbi:MAG: gliding motility-associated C-terminal domain-containing protein, partial [Bacteroidales bacterium]|nr:gliding motility-associated C-terminal domain-containing protein [Bacteroidales bacterium]